MISDTLANAIEEIKGYKAWENYARDREDLETLVGIMDGVRANLDNPTFNGRLLDGTEIARLKAINALLLDKLGHATLLLDEIGQTPIPVHEFRQAIAKAKGAK